MKHNGSASPPAKAAHQLLGWKSPSPADIHTKLQLKSIAKEIYVGEIASLMFAFSCKLFLIKCSGAETWNMTTSLFVCMELYIPPIVDCCQIVATNITNIQAFFSSMQTFSISHISTAACNLKDELWLKQRFYDSSGQS